MNTQLLKAKLVSKGKNVDWLAEQIGLSRASLYKRLGGETQVSLEEANEIRKVLHLDMQEVKDIFFTEKVN